MSDDVVSPWVCDYRFFVLSLVLLGFLCLLGVLLLPLLFIGFWGVMFFG